MEDAQVKDAQGKPPWAGGHDSKGTTIAVLLLWTVLSVIFAWLALTYHWLFWLGFGWGAIVLLGCIYELHERSGQ